MKVQCKNCLPKEGIEIPDFSLVDKIQLWEARQNSPLRAVSILIKEKGFTHRAAKFITAHINDEYGQCNRCNFKALKEEYTKCPKCGALNFNWDLNLKRTN